MTMFEDKDLVAQKALATAIVGELLPANENLAKQCEKRILEIEHIEQKLVNAENFGKIDTLSKESEEKRSELIKLLSIKNRIQNIASRNNQRIDYIKRQFEASGLYKEDVNKKELDAIESGNIENVSEQTLGLNIGKMGISQKFFSDIICIFKNNKLDFSIPENKQILISADEGTLHEIISRFPESVATIGADVLVFHSVKRKILKEITAYVYDESKHQSFRDINKNLGGLLSFRKEIPDTFETYIVGVQNMFNVLVKTYLKVIYPNRIDDIEKLKCNENSALIPEERLNPLKKRVEDKEEEDFYSATSDLEYGREVGGESNESEEESITDENKSKISEDDEAAIELLKALGIGVDDEDEEN